MESGIPKDYNIRNPSFTAKNPGSSTWDPVSTSQDPESKTVMHFFTWGVGGGGGGGKGYISPSLSFQATRFYSHSVLLLA